MNSMHFYSTHPLIGEGLIDALQADFYARGAYWSLEIGGPGGWFHEQYCGPWPTAGAMSPAKARALVSEATVLYYRERLGQIGLAAASRRARRSLSEEYFAKAVYAGAADLPSDSALSAKSILLVDTNLMQTYLAAGAADLLVVDGWKMILSQWAEDELLGRIPPEAAGEHPFRSAEMMLEHNYRKYTRDGRPAILASDDPLYDFREEDGRSIRRWNSAAVLGWLHESGRITNIQYAMTRDALIATGRLANNNITAGVG